MRGTKRRAGGAPVGETRRKTVKPDAANLSPDTSPVLKGGMPQALGIRITSLKRRKIIGEMSIKPIHMNLNGRVNGGAIMAFADVLGAVGASVNRPPGYRGGTIESKTNFFSAGTGPVLTAVCVPLHIGRTTSVWQTTITSGDGSMVTQTQISVPASRAQRGENEKAHADDEQAKRLSRTSR